MEPGKKESTRDKWLCEVFGDYNIVFVSGAVCFGPSSGKITSFQGIHRTVIDYVTCSRALFSDIVSFTVADQVEGYDHAALAVSIKLDVGDSNTILERPRKKAKVDVVLPDDEDKKLYALYGPVLVTTTPIRGGRSRRQAGCLHDDDAATAKPARKPTPAVMTSSVASKSKSKSKPKPKKAATDDEDDVLPSQSDDDKESESFQR
ncbi:hypothetical protein K438DRAFT_2023576 [Mycena galopus ATCC 62051]|nr:hypothetical protein K438DRAFT_2023576 [Mycena galopus ATCC 62051]